MSIKFRALVLLALTVFLAARAIVSSASETSISQVIALPATHLKLTAAEMESLASGEVVARDLPASHTKEMAVFGAAVAEAEPKNFIEAFQSLSPFKQSKNVIACGRFEEDLSVKDLDGL